MKFSYMYTYDIKNYTSLFVKYKYIYTYIVHRYLYIIMYEFKTKLVRKSVRIFIRV